MACIVTACEVMASVVMADIVMAYIAMAYVVRAYIVMVYIAMAYIVMVYTVMAYMIMGYRVMAYIVMARCHKCCRTSSFLFAKPSRPATRLSCVTFFYHFLSTSEHADGERRGPLPIRMRLRMRLAETCLALPSDSIEPLGVRRRHAPRSCPFVKLTRPATRPSRVII